MPTIGQAIHERPDGSGIFDVYDRIGTTHYPNVADVCEKLFDKGASRRASKRTDFEKLTSRSRLILAHERAILLHVDQYYDVIEQEIQRAERKWSCLKGIFEHEKPIALNDNAWKMPPHEKFGQSPVCAAVWWEDVVGGEAAAEIETDPPKPIGRRVRRQVGDVTYDAYHAPKYVDQAAIIGFFASLPTGIWPPSIVSYIPIILPYSSVDVKDENNVL